MAKNKKDREPEYINSPLNTPMLNYKEYYFSGGERLLTVLLCFLAGGLVGLVFYGGLFKDAEGNGTTATIISNCVVFALVGFVGTIFLLPVLKERKKNKRKKELTHQFRSFLESLVISLSSGMNISNSLISTYNDLQNEYTADDYIMHEVNELIEGMQQNVSLEEMLVFFGERSDIQDIKNFASVFEIGYRSGGDMKEIVKRTNSIIAEKIEIEEEIQTALSSNRTQFTVMMFIPVVLVLMFRIMSSTFAASFATVAGVIAITIAIALFIAAYFLGTKIMNIEE